MTVDPHASTPCRICSSAPARPGRRDGRCGTCAAYWHRYKRERTETLVIRNNIRRFEQTIARQIIDLYR